MADHRPPAGYALVPTRLQTVVGKDVRCNLCLWRCRLSHGQRGFCQAHVNRHGTLYNLSYGIISAIDVGPIEAKPVRHYRPGSRVMSIGSYGCNFRCPGCHNPEISWGAAALDALAKGESTAAYVPPDELVAAALRSGVQGIAFTYSEPAVWLEYVDDVAQRAHQVGLYTVYVSNSFVTDEALDALASHMDVLCSDIKSLDQAFYRKICGMARVSQVLGSIAHAQELGIWVETRTNVIPGRNDDPQMLRDIAIWIRDHLGADSPWHITRFFPAFKMKDVPATPPDTLWRARDAALAAGLHNVYVYDDKGCDCATENLPVNVWLGREAAELHARKQCASNCCGEQGVLLKKYERELAPA